MSQFIFMRTEKKHFIHFNGVALRFALKQRLETTRKRPIKSSFDAFFRKLKITLRTSRPTLELTS